MLKAISLAIVSVVVAALSAMAALTGISAAQAPAQALAVPIFYQGFASENLAERAAGALFSQSQAAQAQAVQAQILAAQGRSPAETPSQTGATLASPAETITTISDQVAQLARASYIAEPTTAGSVSAFALTAPDLDDEARLRLMEESQQLTKRNPLAIIWLAGEAAKRGDLASVIKQYDLGMRRGGNVAGTLSAGLAGITAREGAPQILETMFLDNPPWAGRYWAKLPQYPAALPNGTDLRIRMMDRQLDPVQFNDPALMNALVQNRMFDQAWRLYDALAPGQAPDQVLHNGDFTQPTLYAPLDWQLTRQGTFGSGIDTARGTMEVNATNARRSTLAQQLIRLPSGSYALSIVASGKEKGAKLPVSLQLACADGTSSMVPRMIDLANDQPITLANNAAACTYYWLRLVTNDNVPRSGFNLAIDQISIRKQ